MIQSSAPSAPNSVSEDIPVSFGPGDRVAVLLQLPVEGAYDYRVPEDITVSVGDLVEVPLGRRFDIGVVWGAGDGDLDEAKIKDVVHRLDLPRLPRALLSFIDWVADYTIQPRGVVLRMAMRSAKGLKPQAPETHLSRAKSPPADLKVTAARGKALDALGDRTFVGAALLAKTAGVMSRYLLCPIQIGQGSRWSQIKRPRRSNYHQPSVADFLCLYSKG